MTERQRPINRRSALDSTSLHNNLVEKESALIDLNHKRGTNYATRNDITVESIDINLLRRNT